METGASAAFVTTRDDPVIDPQLIAYVSAFVPRASGESFNPHVTTGVASREFLDKMQAEPFEIIHLFSDGCGGLPARPVRHGSEEAQGVGAQTIRLLRIRLAALTVLLVSLSIPETFLMRADAAVE